VTLRRYTGSVLHLTGRIGDSKGRKKRERGGELGGGLGILLRNPAERMKRVVNVPKNAAMWNQPRFVGGEYGFRNRKRTGAGGGERGRGEG